MEKKNEALSQKREVAAIAVARADQGNAAKKEEQKKKEDDRLNDYMNKVQARKKQAKAAAELRKIDRGEEETAKERLVRVKDEQNQKARQAAYTIKKDIERRNNMVEAALALKNEEHEQRKEITMLRKFDQEENFMRSKNFHNLYKQKLAERILEKASRVNKSAIVWDRTGIHHLFSA